MPERSFLHSSGSFQDAERGPRQSFGSFQEANSSHTPRLHIDCKGAIGWWRGGATAENTLTLLLIAFLPAFLHIQVFVIVEGVVIKSFAGVEIGRAEGRRKSWIVGLAPNPWERRERFLTLPLQLLSRHLCDVERKVLRCSFGPGQCLRLHHCVTLPNSVHVPPQLNYLLIRLLQVNRVSSSCWEMSPGTSREMHVGITDAWILTWWSSKER